MQELLKEKIDNIKKNPCEYEVVYEFLCVYYDDFIWKVGNSGEEKTDYPVELTLELEDRVSGVYEAMVWLVEQGFDLNEGDCFNPLMMAVGSADAPMTRFLILNGADANYWPEMEETPEQFRSNYYLEDIDIAYFNEDPPADKVYVDALLKTTRVLLEDGKTGSFGGLCLLADAEKREISLGSPQYKY